MKKAAKKKPIDILIAEDNPTLLGADENRFASALAYQDRDLQEELNIIHNIICISSLIHTGESYQDFETLITHSFYLPLPPNHHCPLPQ